MRGNLKRESCGLLVPDAMIVTGFDLEGVLAGFEICVIRNAVGCGLAPVSVATFQTVRKSHFFWRDKTVPRIMDLYHTATSGMEPDWLRMIDPFSINDDLLDH